MNITGKPSPAITERKQLRIRRCQRRKYRAKETRIGAPVFNCNGGINFKEDWQLLG
jgi:hypothetical protein